VDASGQSATVARQYGFREFDDDLRFSAFWGRFDGGSYLDYHGETHAFERRFDRPPVTFVESLGDWGWVWYIVLREHVSVGIILPPSGLKTFKQRNGTLDQKFEAEVRETAHASRLLADASFRPGSVRGIRNYAYKPVHLVVDGCYLVGDAAAFVDPINSAGVTFGMYAGALAAGSIERSLHDPSRAERHQALYAHQYRQRLEVFRLLALPPDCAGESDDARLVEALRFFSQTERELALTTTVLTHRSDRLAALLSQAGTEVNSVYDDIPLPAGFAQDR
jgi:flavin-dependent dehydrogenase